MNRARFLILLFGLVQPAAAQHDHSPYAGYQNREIKALSAEQVDEYLNGAGIGLALAAELNSYPGPRHVLELSAELELSEEQATATLRAQETMKSRAIAIGVQIVELERQLDRLFAERAVTDDVLQSRIGEIAQLHGELRAAHLRAHLLVSEILTGTQRIKYDSLRGYNRHR